MKTVKQISIKVDRVRVAEGSPLYLVAGRPLVSPDIVVDMVDTLLGETDVESFVVFPLDVRNRPLGVELVARGSVDGCPVDVRSVFRAAIVLGASAIVVAHNHPSGDPDPSAEDRTLTERLKAAGKILGLPLLDHVIVGDGRHYSFAAEGSL